MQYVPDNYDMFVRHEAEQQAQLDKLPVCCECKEPIQDEYAYYIYGEWVCEQCMNENYRIRITD